MHMKKIFITALTFMFACFGFAQQTIIVDNPDIEESAGPECPEEHEDGDCTCGDGEDGNYINNSIMMYDLIDMPFEVEGTPNIESFVTALPFFDKEFLVYEEPLVDKKNGYFYYSSEGAGGVRYHAAYWNLKDGNKLFIFSWWCADFVMNELGSGKLFGTVEAHNDWYRYSVIGDIEKDESLFSIDTGFRAYLYDKNTHRLVPYNKMPITGMPETTNHRFLILPQNGKDIKVEEFVYDSMEGRLVGTHTLKWNGEGFNYVR